MSAAARKVFTTPKDQSLAFTRVGFGGAPLGNMHRALGPAEAEATVEAAWAGGLRYFDTAPLYGHGLSETRIGNALRSKPREEFVLSTKVGRLLEPCAPGEEASGIYKPTPALKVRFDYTHDGVLRSLAASLARLGTDRVDILYVHDLERPPHGDDYESRWADLTDGGGWRALDDLRAAGVVSAIGLGVNQAAPCERMLAELDPDLFLLAGRYTLLEQAPLHGLLPNCERRGVGVVIGGPFNSGVLVRPDGAYNYAAASPEITARVDRLRAVCARFDVPLPAAALRFVLAHPAVVSVVPGAQTVDEVASNAALMDHPIPDDLWAALQAEGLIDVGAPVPEPMVAAC
ncbi:MAG TPA: aldo/keto reductase [Caulobacteraceae bacterium]|jgi:D-threo-aldose 1-dehydrogenase